MGKNKNKIRLKYCDLAQIICNEYTQAKYLILALLGFQFLNFQLKPFVDPMPVEL